MVLEKLVFYFVLSVKISTVMIHLKRFCPLLLVLAILAPGAAFAQKSKRKKKPEPPVESKYSLNLKLEDSPVFSQHFAGFALYDPSEDKVLYEYNGDKYFTPASNTKIFTLYTCLQLLGDSIPALLYTEQGDLSVFWGTGDPAFLNPHLQQNGAVYQFLKNRRGELLFCPANFKDHRYGSGWMWSDYPYSYQAEKSPFPVYSNVAHFRRDSAGAEIKVLPGFLKNQLKPGAALEAEDAIGRSEFENQFTLNGGAAKKGAFEWHVPYRYSPAFLAELLTDTLGRPVHVLEANLLPPKDAKVLYSLRADSLYLPMMQESDNFIAEQLLLLCSQRKFGEMNTEKVIDFAKEHLLYDLPDKIYWVDGSGLSRYNLFTPRSTVKLLHKIYQLVPQQRLFGIFPAGGVSGTIKSNYRNGSQPYVFAKTGTLRNNHCLSGYLLTQKGKVLIFSFMHNNFTGGTSQIKREMERVLKEVRAKF
jgi:D-alanyl-D-alanine carboxypeptidase/D-alanyl-D-alanine-endopeptidase (penicillin-binding protein 4)